MSKKKTRTRATNGPLIQERPTLVVEGRSMAVPTNPLNVSVWLQLPTRPRCWGDDQRLAFDFCLGARLIGAMALCVGLTCVLLFAFMMIEDAELLFKAIMISVGLFLTSIGSGLLLLPAWHEFDRKARRYRRRSWIAPIELSMDSIVGIQILSGIEVAVRSQEDGDVRWDTHQLLLVIYNQTLRREILFSGADEASITAMGKKLASFLNVPLLMN